MHPLTARGAFLCKNLKILETPLFSGKYRDKMTALSKNKREVLLCLHPLTVSLNLFCAP